MIAKRVPRKAGHSSYSHLAEYILDSKNNGKKVSHAWSSNLASEDDFQLAIMEVMATQQLNTRSKNDKTYHLVVSLAMGEDLSLEQFKTVANRFSEAIGLTDHHRICVVHGDTDNLHLHMAISKVHPLTFNSIEPYYDKLKLQNVCREFEKKYGLQVDIGYEMGDRSDRQTQGEIHLGMESFSSWIKTNFREPFRDLIGKNDGGWSQAQVLAGKYGLEIRERGSGLVISHVNKKLFVKASTIDRAFSRKYLVAVAKYHLLFKIKWLFIKLMRGDGELLIFLTPEPLSLIL